MHQGGRGRLTAHPNAPQCWKVRALTQILMDVQKPAVDLQALERNQKPKAGPPAQSPWMTAAQDPGTTSGHLPPTAKPQLQVTQVAGGQTCKSELQLSLLSVRFDLTCISTWINVC